MLEERRREQAIAWMHALIREALQAEFYQNAAVKARVAGVEQAVAAGVKPSLAAAKELLAAARAAKPLV
jgi:LAO/AO transport system kinase